MGCLFSTVVFAEPDDLEKPEVLPKQVFTSSKPVTCTTDSYETVKQNFFESHGEVGFMRFISDSRTAVEVIGNVTTGTISILEFIPSNEYTCFISVGKGLQVNSNIFEKAVEGVETNYFIAKSIDNVIPMWYK